MSPDLGNITILKTFDITILNSVLVTSPGMDTIQKQKRVKNSTMVVVKVRFINQIYTLMKMRRQLQQLHDHV